MKMENHSNEFIQFLVNNDIEYSPVPTFAYRNREGVVPLWDVVDRHIPEYFRFEVRALPTGDDDDTDFENRSENCQWCHLCDVSVPIAFLTEHHASAKHLSCTAIAQSALQRLTRQLSVPPPAARPPRPHTYLCEQCACAVSVRRRRDVHAQSAAHRSAVAHDRLLRALQAVYCDRSSAQQQYSALLRDGDDEMLRDSDDDGEERDRCDLPPAYGDGEKETQSVVKEDECVLETGKTFADVLRTPKVSQQDSKPENKKQLTVLTASGAVLRVDVNAYHGLYESPLGAACRLCGCNVYDKESHQLDAAHVRMLAQPARDLHGIREIDSVWRHCMLCNETIDCRSVTSHVAGAKHVTCLERALVRPGDDTQPDVHVREEGLTRQEAAELLSIHNSKTSDIQTAHHHVKKTKKAFKCLVCQTTLSKCDVDDHIQTVEHVNKFVDLLNDHLLSKVDASMLFCELCRIDVFVGDELNHIKQKGHLGARKVLGERSVKELQVKLNVLNAKAEVGNLEDDEDKYVDVDEMYHVIQNKVKHRCNDSNIKHVHSEKKTFNDGNEYLNDHKNMLEHNEMNFSTHCWEELLEFDKELKIIEKGNGIEVSINTQIETNDAKKVEHFNENKENVNDNIMNRVKNVYDRKVYDFCQICSVYIHKTLLTDHLNEDGHKNALIKCNETAAEYNLPNGVKPKPLSVFEVHAKSIICNICNVIITNSILSLQSHVDSKKHYKKVKKNLIKITEDNNVFKCFQCDITFPNSLGDYKHHIEESHNVKQGEIRSDILPKTDNNVKMNANTKTEDKKKDVPQDAKQETKTDDVIDGIENCITCNESFEEAEFIIPINTVTEYVSTQYKDDKLKNNTAASKVTVFETSDISQSNDDSYIDSINHLLDPTMNLKELKCKICDCVVANKTAMIIEHVNGIKHKNKYETLIQTNRLQERPGKYFCECCKDDVPKPDLYNHIDGIKHKVKIFKILLQDNEITKQDHIHYCTVCKIQLDVFNIRTHVISEEHKRNLNISRMKEHETENEYTCDVCNVNIVNNPFLIQLHNHTDEHVKNLRKAKESSEVCNIELKLQVPDNDSKDVINKAAKEQKPVNSSNNIDTSAHCDICNVKIPNNPRNITEHYNGMLHKTNEQTIINNEALVETARNTNMEYLIWDYKCEICDVYVTNNPKNIKEHNNGARHRTNEKIIADDIEKNGRSLVNNDTGGDINKGNNTKDEIGDINERESNKISNVEKEQQVLNDNDSKYLINKAVKEQKPVTSSNNIDTSAHCDICNVKIPNNPRNITEHYNGMLHKTNEQKIKHYEALVETARNTNIWDYKCEICDVYVTNNPKNIKEHNNGARHRTNKKIIADDIEKNGQALVNNEIRDINKDNNKKAEIRDINERDSSKVSNVDMELQVLNDNDSKDKAVKEQKPVTSSNNIDTSAYCDICNVKIPNNPRNITEHYNGMLHKTNEQTIINNEALVETARNTNIWDYKCQICDVNVTNNPKNIKEHNNGARHRTNEKIFADEKNGQSLVNNEIRDMNKDNNTKDEIGDINERESNKISNVEKEQQVLNDNDSKYLINKAVKEQKPVASSNNIDTSAYCDICNVKIPNNPRNITEHYNGMLHKTNEQTIKHYEALVETARNTNIWDYKCEVCDVYVTNNPKNIKEHNNGARHRTNEKIIADDIEKNGRSLVNNEIRDINKDNNKEENGNNECEGRNIEEIENSTISSILGVIRGLSDVNIQNDPESINPHKNEAICDDNKKKATGIATAGENSATHSKLCEIDTPKHTNTDETELHEDEEKAATNGADESTKVEFNVCDVYIPNNPRNINKHDIGASHKPNERELNEVKDNNIVSNETSHNPRNENVLRTEIERNNIIQALNAIQNYTLSCTFANSHSRHVKCGFCKIYVANNQTSINVHNNAESHEQSQKIM